MKVLRPINNNVVSAIDDGGDEIIIIGTGIGYKACTGTPVSRDKVQKIYRMDIRDDGRRAHEALELLPGEFIELAADVFEYAKNTLQKTLYERTVIALADHIYFAACRYREGMEFHNELMAEIRRFYKAEWEVGVYALGLIEQRTGVRFEDDEAASIAIYIRNAEYDMSVHDTVSATQLLKEILGVIEKETGSAVGGEDYDSTRFLTHLKYLTLRVEKKELFPEDDEMHDLFQNGLAGEIRCAKMIGEHIKEKTGFQLSGSEISTLTLHLRKTRLLRK